MNRDEEGLVEDKTSGLAFDASYRCFRTLKGATCGWVLFLANIDIGHIGRCRYGVSNNKLISRDCHRQTRTPGDLALLERGRQCRKQVQGYLWWNSCQ